MATYTVVLSAKAVKQLDKLSDHIAKPILYALANLQDVPRPNGCKKLKGRDGHRIRVKDYSTIYEILYFELVVNVVTLGHRREYI